MAHLRPRFRAAHRAMLSRPSDFNRLRRILVPVRLAGLKSVPSAPPFFVWLEQARAA
jgi:hypothetical protein